MSRSEASSYIGEQWATVPKSPNFEVSSYGRVKNTKTAVFLKVVPHVKSGLLRVTLRGDGKKQRCYSMNRLVAELFLEDYDPEFEVGFHNGDKNDIRVSNLFMSTKGRRGPRPKDGRP